MSRPTEQNRVLVTIYTFFLGLLLAIFVGVGVETFYPSPSAPRPPIELSYEKELNAEQKQQQREFDAQMLRYEDSMKPYNRNVSIIMLTAAIVFVIVSLVFEHRIRIISDGVMLGGFFSLLYGLARGFASQNSKYVFVAVAVGLAVVLYLGYHRFVKPLAHSEKSTA